MDERWTNEVEEHWQAIFEEAANPKDCLTAHDINWNERRRGLVRSTVAAITYRTLGGDKPLSLRLEIESANIHRQIGPARLKECEDWLKEEPFFVSGDFDWFDG